MKQLKVPGGMMSYQDVGAGVPVVLVHGTPSSSAEWQTVTQHLKTKFRVLAPDHLGFGKSERPEPIELYRLPWHAENFRSWMDQLDLPPFHLVVHDFGGPIALPYAIEHAARLRSVTVIQSWLWDLKGPKIDNALMRWLYLSWNFSARQLVPIAWGKRSPLSRERHQAFMQQFPDRQSRFGTWGFVHSVVREGAWMDEQGEQLSRLSQVPGLVVWGKADKIVKAVHLEEWQRRLPNFSSLVLEDVGHFPQLEAAQEVADALVAFLQSAK
jgi:haloalkane dehalogenase